MSAAQLEVVHPATDEQALAVIKQNAITPDTAQSLTASFAPLFTEARSILEKSRGITVTDASQTLEIKLARECRLALRKVRVAGDKARKELKESALRTGRAIDGFYNILLHLTEEEENRLDEQEKFVDRQEAARKAAAKAEREAALKPYGIDTTFYNLAEMGTEAWGQLLANTKAAHEAKLEAARKAEEERVRLENERLKEEARIREENERLRREAAERETAAKAEREAAEAERRRLEAEKRAVEEKARKEREAAEAEAARVLAEQKRKAEAEAKAAAEKSKAERLAAEQIAAAERKKAEEIARREREAREALEAKLKAEKEAEARRVREEAAHKAKAERAPDREKLASYRAALRAIPIPTAKTEAGKIAVAAAERAVADALAAIERVEVAL